MKKHPLQLSAQSSSGDGSLANDLTFLAAWEGDTLPRSIDPATILRIRQILRANSTDQPTRKFQT
jgi:hypothetical protein